MNKTFLIAGLLATGIGVASQHATAANIQVTLTNNATAGGTYLTPAWFGFHDGNFDVFDTGSSASTALESLAEDGSTAALDAAFKLAQTNGISGQANGGPVAPSASSTTVFSNLTASNNNWFSFAAMVIPSNDFFIGNNNPLAWNISSLINGETNSLSFDVVRVYDAGTEVNDFATSAGNGLFANVSGGQNGPNQGADENAFISVASGADFGSFANLSNVTGSDVSGFNFDNYASIATIQLSTVAAVPEPETYAMFLAGLGLMGVVNNRRRTIANN